MDLAERENASLPLRRPVEFATDTSEAIEYARHALAELRRQGEGDYDIVVIIPPTAPFTHGSDIDQTIDLLLQPDTDGAVTVVKVPHDVHPLKMKTMEGDFLRPLIEEEKGRMMAHQLPHTYVRNCAVYAIWRRAMEKQGTLIGEHCRGYEMPAERSIDINTELDLSVAQVMATRLGFSP